MNDKQKAAKEVLQNELLKQRGIIKPLSDDGESKEGYSFTEVERVTVCFGPDGGLILPSVRSYKNALLAAVYADDEFKKNRKTQKISISSITQTASRREVIKILAAVSDRAGKPQQRDGRTDGRLVGFRPRVLFKSSDFNDLPTKQSPHGGTVRMARNSRSR